MFYLISLVTGLLFGMGMVLSGMIDPQLVTAFLDVTGNWKSPLMFVMGGALLVFIPGYFLLVKPRSRPVLGGAWAFNTTQTIDRPLLGGACLFGVGWGLLGVCPGPAVTSLLAGNSDVWLFLAALMLGITLNKMFIAYRTKQTSST